MLKRLSRILGEEIPQPSCRTTRHHPKLLQPATLLATCLLALLLLLLILLLQVQLLLVLAAVVGVFVLIRQKQAVNAHVIEAGHKRAKEFLGLVLLLLEVVRQAARAALGSLV